LASGPEKKASLVVGGESLGSHILSFFVACLAVALAVVSVAVLLLMLLLLLLSLLLSKGHARQVHQECI